MGGAVELGVDFAGLRLSHPIVNGSGTFDAIAARRVFGDEVLERFPFSAFVSKTITLEPRAGNPPARLWETPSGLVNSIGLPNKGLAGFLGHDLPALAELPVPLIVSVMGTSQEQFEQLVDGVASSDAVAALELNVSCPNVHSGLIVGEEPRETDSLLRRLRPLTDKPLIVKLTPNVADPVRVAVAAAESGADGLCLINTIKAAALAPGTRRPWLGGGRGGLSGAAVRPVAMQQLLAVSEAVSLPLIGMGGVASGADALDMICAGATLVGVGTENFRDPRAGEKVARELGESLATSGFESPAAAAGRAADAAQTA